jgi:hypothetical protein
MSSMKRLCGGGRQKRALPNSDMLTRSCSHSLRLYLEAVYAGCTSWLGLAFQESDMQASADQTLRRPDSYLGNAWPKPMQMARTVNILKLPMWLRGRLEDVRLFIPVVDELWLATEPVLQCQ